MDGGRLAPPYISSTAIITLDGDVKWCKKDAA